MNELENLAAQARAGDPLAANRLRHELEARLGPIVRRALRGGASPLDGRIRAAARGHADDQRSLGGAVGNVCASVVGGLTPPPDRGALETVRC